MTEFIEQLFHNLFGTNVWLATILIAMVPIIELKGAIPFSMSAQIWGGESLGLFHAFLAGLVGSSLVVPILVLLYKPIINLLKKTKLFRSLAQKIEERVNSKKRKVEQDISSENLRGQATENINVRLGQDSDIQLQNCTNSQGNVDIGAHVEDNLNKHADVKFNEYNDKNNNEKTCEGLDAYAVERLNDKRDKVCGKPDVMPSRKANSLKKRIAAVFVFVALPFPFTGVWTGACLAVALGLNFWQATTTVVLGNVVAGGIIAFVSWLFGDATLIFFYAFLAFILVGILFFATRAIIRKCNTRHAKDAE